MVNFLASFVFVCLCVLKRRFHIYFSADFDVENGWTELIIFLKRCTSKKTPMILLNGSSQAVQKVLPRKADLVTGFRQDFLDNDLWYNHAGGSDDLFRSFRLTFQ